MSEEAVKQSEREVLAASQIGAFIFWFSQIEGSLRLGLAGALNLPFELYEVVTASYAFAKLCDVTEAVFRFRWADDPGKVAALEKIISRCKGVNETRVKIVHGSWMPSSAAGLSAFHMSGKMRVRPLFTGPEELGRAVTECRKLSQDALTFFLLKDEKRRRHTELEDQKRETKKLTTS